MSFPPNAITDSGFSRVEPLITPDQVKQRYLFGVNLTDEKGNPLPDEVFQHQINAAVSFLEHELDIVILKTTFQEQYDYRAIDYINFNFLQLKKRPAIEVTEIKARFPNSQNLVDYPTDWFVLEKESAQIQLSPVEGTFSGLIVTQGGSYLPLMFGTRDYWPHLFHVVYDAGFCDDKIPIIINEMIGMQAAIRIFEIMGDLVFGPGVSSESVGLDGASVSKSSTASNTNNAYGARIESYKKQMEKYTKSVKKYYNAIPSIIG